jgi:hypothetical protein
MWYTLVMQVSDIFIGSYDIAENYGSNTPEWVARRNLQGCPGVVWKMPSLTPILSSAEGYVSKIDFEEGGKGKYVIVQHEGFQTVYGHLNDIVVKEEERVIASQLIAHSNQSGLAPFPCLEFQIIPTDQAGNKIEDNGYGGAINPLDYERVQWEIQGIKEPAVKVESSDKMLVSPTEYSDLTAQSTNYKVIASYLVNNGFNDWLKSVGRNPINLDSNKNDNTVGESLVMYHKSLADEFSRLERLSQKIYKKEEPKKIDKPFVLKRFFSFKLFK